MHRDLANQVIQKEITGLKVLASKLDDEFNKAIDALLSCTHHVAISGMGKAGLIGNKIAATLASTGTPSFFMHPAEAIHGDFGMLRKEDVVILMSYGGETEEITRLIPMLKILGNKTIAMTRSKDSTLGKGADITLEIGKLEEACPMGLAPTTSTTAMLALGDAMAVVLLTEKNFDEKKYAFFHPGGSLGKKLLKVKDVMRTGSRCPILPLESSVKDVVLAISEARSGAAIITDKNQLLAGVFTDGDLRRHLIPNSNVLDCPIAEIMTQNPKYLTGDLYALDAVSLLKKNMIGDLPVVDEKMHPIGLIDLKDLVNIGLLDL